MKDCSERYFSSSYTFGRNNFIVKGAGDFDPSIEGYPFFCVAENLLQRGMPTRPSNLLEGILGEPPSKLAGSGLVADDSPRWTSTIKGLDGSSINPALLFYEELLPNALPKRWRFLMQLMLPEALIEDIVDDSRREFADQRVDFYLPCSKLVIEIDGIQHERPEQRLLDEKRDRRLAQEGILTLRISAAACRKGSSDVDYAARLIVDRCVQAIVPVVWANVLGEEEWRQVAIYETVMRVQIAVLQLLKAGRLTMGDSEWRFGVRSTFSDALTRRIARAGLEDLFAILGNLGKLADSPIERPKVSFVSDEEDPDIVVDVSVLTFWSEKESCADVVYVRNDYFRDKDYFEVATAPAVRYATDCEGEDKRDIEEALYFFLDYLFSYPDFRPGQMGIIKKALARHATLGILPTGSGKSLCYQMACLLQPCISFVVCPIISLIQDQERNAREFDLDRVGRIESQMATEEKIETIRNFGQGKYLLVWISPERFQVSAFREELRAIAAERFFGYAVIDEVHCLSEWGHDFRVSYLKLPDVVRTYCPDALLLGLTATASNHVLADLLAELDISRDSVQAAPTLDRPELSYHIIETTVRDRLSALDAVLDEIDGRHGFGQDEGSVFAACGDRAKCGIVFSNTARSPRSCPGSGCEDIKAHLLERGIRCDSYHSRRENARSEVQRRFLDNEFTVMVATKSFGMGVNKRNVRYTVHSALPWSIEAFYQEAGRAGRDEHDNQSDCYILYVPERDEELVRALFAPGTSIEEIHELQHHLVGDLGTIFFLWNHGHDCVADEKQRIWDVFKELQRKRGNDGRALLPQHFVGEKTENALYKLALVGVVCDWTIDYARSLFVVEVRDLSEDDEAFSRGELERYLRRHSAGFSFDNPSPAHEKYVDIYRKAREGKKFFGLIDVLLVWANDNIVYQRRAAIGNMLRLCQSGWPEERIRSYINSFFKLDASCGDLLDVVVSSYSSFEPWLDVFYLREAVGEAAAADVVLEDRRALRPLAELRDLPALCDRYRESNNANVGLEWVALVARVLVDETIGSDWISGQLEFLSVQLPQYRDLDAGKLFGETLLLVACAPKASRRAFGAAVVRSIPERAQEAYEILGDEATLAFVVDEALHTLQSLWGKAIYGEAKS